MSGHRDRSRSSLHECRRPWAALLLCLALCLAGGPAAATPDMRIVIDISGSMKETDPRNLRVPALRLLIGLLPADSRAGVWTFGRYVNMLVPYGQVDAAWRDEALRRSAGVSSVAFHTDIEAALRTATWNWQAPAADGSRRHLVLLTDGAIDVPGAAGESARSRERVTRDLLPRLQRAGAAVHAIALSGGTDEPLLRQLATATGGSFERVDDTGTLERVFLRLFERTVQPATLPLAGREFLIDARTGEFTLLAFRREDSRPAGLLSPDGQAHGPERLREGMHWHRGERYDLVTVAQPAAGTWRIEGEPDPDNRVMVASGPEPAANPSPSQSVADGRERLTAQPQQTETASMPASALAPETANETGMPTLAGKDDAETAPPGRDWTRIGLAIMLINLGLGVLLLLGYWYMNRRPGPTAATASIEPPPEPIAVAAAVAAAAIAAPIPPAGSDEEPAAVADPAEAEPAPVPETSGRAAPVDQQEAETISTAAGRPEAEEIVEADPPEASTGDEAAPEAMASEDIDEIILEEIVLEKAADADVAADIALAGEDAGDIILEEVTLQESAWEDTAEPVMPDEAASEEAGMTAAEETITPAAETDMAAAKPPAQGGSAEAIDLIDRAVRKGGLEALVSGAAADDSLLDIDISDIDLSFGDEPAAQAEDTPGSLFGDPGMTRSA